MLFIISILILVISTSLTLFSIFFNYDEDKPVKLSKFGWMAVALAILLAIATGVVKKIEHSQSMIQEIKNDSLQNQLIIKNDKLLTLITSFEKESLRNLDTIQNRIINNISTLETTNEELTKVTNSLNKNRLKLEKKIYEYANPLPDNILIDASFVLDSAFNAIHYIFKDKLDFEIINDKTAFVNKIISELSDKRFQDEMRRGLFTDIFMGIDFDKTVVGNELGCKIKAVKINLDTYSGNHCNLETNRLKPKFTYLPSDTKLHVYIDYECDVRKGIHFSSKYDICNLGYAEIKLDFNYSNIGDIPEIKKHFHLSDISLNLGDWDLYMETKDIKKSTFHLSSPNQFHCTSRDSFYIKYEGNIFDCGK